MHNHILGPAMRLAALLILTITSLQAHAADVILVVSGENQNVYVTDPSTLCSTDITLPPKGTASTAYKQAKNAYYYSTDCTFKYLNGVRLGLVFKVLSGDPSIIRFCRSKTSSATVYCIPELKSDGFLYFERCFNSTGSSTSTSNNSFISNTPATLEFALTAIPETPLTIQIYGCTRLMGIDTNMQGNTSLTITFMGAQEPAEQGGLVKKTALHYAGLGDILDHNVTWASGDIHPADDLTTTIADIIDYDPARHTIDAPTETEYSIANTLSADSARCNVSMVVSLTPDRISKAQTALVAAEVRNAKTGEMETLVNDDNSVVYHQVSIGGTADGANPSMHGAGTVTDYAHNHSWADADDNVATASVALHLGTKLNDIVRGKKYTSQVAANAVTYVMDAPVDAATAAKIAGGNGTAGTDYKYVVRQPVFVDILTPSGVDDIAADRVDAPAQYITLQGTVLTGRPTAPGIYIERTPTATRKILVR